MKSSFIALFLFLIPAITLAVPSDGVLRNFTQPDGKTLSLRLVGDEHLHFFKTTDEYVVVEGAGGGFFYAELQTGSLIPSSILAHNPEERNVPENEFLSARNHKRYDRNILDSLRVRHQYRQHQANSRRLNRKRRALGEAGTYFGKKKGLVILVNFQNQKMSTETANADYTRMFNEVGYSENNHVGSVHDYFFDQSYGQFDLTFDVIGPVTVSRNYGYYGSDGIGGKSGDDRNVREMITEACILADKEVNYSDYDWDGDGIVDQVFIIYAGYGQATGGASNTIWPHESHLYDELVLDNVTISQYACSNELYSGKVREGIGVACHEFSHCLGFPDMYDTDYSGAYGMSYWGVMNSGSYNGPSGIGEVPCGYTAYERCFAGWLDFTDITTSQRIKNLPSLEQQPLAYRIYNEGNHDEFYTFENRQPDKWFSYVGDHEGIHGMLVTHIDYDFKAWSTNTVNPSPEHQRMSPIVADNSYGLTYEDLTGDLFPGYNHVTELTNTSHADFGGRLYNENTDGSYNMNVSILDIQEANDGAVSFNVIFNREIPTPIALEAKDVTENSFYAQWTSDVADSYTLELTAVKSIKPFVSDTLLFKVPSVTEFKVSGLDALSFSYRVRANKGALHTEWSNRISVAYKKPDGIYQTQVQSRTEMYGINGLPLNAPQRGDIILSNKKKVLYK